MVGRRRLTPLLLVALLPLVIGVVRAIAQGGGGPVASVGVDIRAISSLYAGQARADYALAVEDCRRLISVVLQNADARTEIAVSDSLALPGAPEGCHFLFSRSDADRYRPRATLAFDDRPAVEHEETFVAEALPPSVTFKGATFTGVPGAQKLVIEAEAQDETDLRSVLFSVVGLRASDLRAHHGIIDAARKAAFDIALGAGTDALTFVEVKSESVFPGSVAKRYDTWRYGAKTHRRESRHREFTLDRAAKLHSHVMIQGGRVGLFDKGAKVAQVRWWYQTFAGRTSSPTAADILDIRTRLTALPPKKNRDWTAATFDKLPKDPFGLEMHMDLGLHTVANELKAGVRQAFFAGASGAARDILTQLLDGN